jgi:putative transposase
VKRNRFKYEQLIQILEEHKAAVSVSGLERKRGFAEGTLHTWKSKFGGMEASDAKRLRDLESENTKRKRLLADEMLEKTALKEALW